jgi:hypothetical protein
MAPVKTKRADRPSARRSLAPLTLEKNEGGGVSLRKAKRDFIPIRLGARARHGAAGYFGRDEGQEELLEALAFLEWQAAQVDAHLISRGEADDRAGAHDGPCIPRKIHADIHEGADGKSPGGANEETLHADIKGLAFDFLPAIPQTNPGSPRDTTNLAALVLHIPLRGANEFEKAILINRFVKDETGAGLKTFGQSAGALVVADHDNRGHVVQGGIAHQACEIKAIRGGHVLVEEHQREFSLVQNAGRFEALCERQEFHAGGAQDFLDEFAGVWFIFDNKRTFLH